MTHRALVCILVGATCLFAPACGYVIGVATRETPREALPACSDDAEDTRQRAIRNAWRHPPHEETPLL